MVMGGWVDAVVVEVRVEGVVGVLVIVVGVGFVKGGGVDGVLSDGRLGVGMYVGGELGSLVTKLPGLPWRCVGGELIWSKCGSKVGLAWRRGARMERSCCTSGVRGGRVRGIGMPGVMVGCGG